jgi:hypothetical protein
MWAGNQPSDSEKPYMSQPLTFTLPEISAEDFAAIRAIHQGLAGFRMMADEPAKDDPKPDPKPEPDKPEPKPDDPLKEPGLKALQAERDARAKAEADLAALRKQVEDAGKTAEQKAADDLKATTARADGAELKALKYEVAADKGIDLKLAGRLNGSTKAELEADADNLKALLGAKPGSPKPDSSQGKGGDGVKATGVAAGRDLFRDTHPTKTT